MKIRWVAAFMLVFTVGLLFGDELWGGIHRVNQMWPERVACGLGAVLLLWGFRHLRSRHS